MKQIFAELQITKPKSLKNNIIINAKNNECIYSGRDGVTLEPDINQKPANRIIYLLPVGERVAAVNLLSSGCRQLQSSNRLNIFTLYLLSIIITNDRQIVIMSCGHLRTTSYEHEQRKKKIKRLMRRSFLFGGFVWVATA